VADAVGVDPAAPRPPVGFRVRVPDAWWVVDLDPRTSDASIDRFLDECVRIAPAATPHRAVTRQALQEVAARNRAEGTFVLAFLAGARRTPKDPVGASLTLAWRRLGGSERLPAADLVRGIAESLETAPLADGERPGVRSVTMVELGRGPAAHLRTAQLVPVPRTRRRRRVAISQLLVPVPGQPWVGVVTATTPNLDLADGVDAIAEGVARSLEFL
jgi:hypothetical protein